MTPGIIEFSWAKGENIYKFGQAVLARSQIAQVHALMSLISVLNKCSISIYIYFFFFNILHKILYQLYSLIHAYLYYASWG
jgi:hypothetical protein